MQFPVIMSRHIGRFEGLRRIDSAHFPQKNIRRAAEQRVLLPDEREADFQRGGEGTEAQAGIQAARQMIIRGQQTAEAALHEGGGIAADDNQTGRKRIASVSSE